MLFDCLFDSNTILVDPVFPLTFNDLYDVSIELEFDDLFMCDPEPIIPSYNYDLHRRMSNLRYVNDMCSLSVNIKDRNSRNRMR